MELCTSVCRVCALCKVCTVQSMHCAKCALQTLITTWSAKTFPSYKKRFAMHIIESKYMQQSTIKYCMFCLTTCYCILSRQTRLSISCICWFIITTMSSAGPRCSWNSLFLEIGKGTLGWRYHQCCLSPVQAAEKRGSVKYRKLHFLIHLHDHVSPCSRS